jgi:hypothetical protein
MHAMQCKVAPLLYKPLAPLVTSRPLLRKKTTESGVVKQGCDAALLEDALLIQVATNPSEF